jgi:hypothetical protein
MNKAQKLLESLNAGNYDPNKLQIRNAPLGGTLYLYKTMISGQEAEFRMTEKRRILDVVFEFSGRGYKRHKMTFPEDTGNMRQMLGITAKMLEDVYYENYRDIGVIRFSADARNPSRVKLYDRFAKMIAVKLGGGETQIRRKFDGESIVFTIILPSAFDRESEGYV